MQRSEAIRRAADWVIDHSTIEEKKASKLFAYHDFFKKENIY